MKLESLMLSGSMICAMCLCGCGDTKAPTPGATTSVLDKNYLFVTEPSGAKGIKETRAESKDADEVTVVGRIGGDEKPWIEGQAAFLLVDTSLKPCNERPGDDCPMPWDYCCDADELPKSKAMVKIVDAGGKTVATDARKLLGVKELQTLVVHGKAKRDEAGNLTVLADKVFIRQ